MSEQKKKNYAKQRGELERRGTPQGEKRREER